MDMYVEDLGGDETIHKIPIANEENYEKYLDTLRQFLVRLGHPKSKADLIKTEKTFKKKILAQAQLNDYEKLPQEMKDFIGQLESEI